MRKVEDSEYELTQNMKLLEQLKQMIESKCLHIGDKDEFRLASGLKSNYYFDLKPVLLDPIGINLICNLVLDGIDGLDVECVGGMEVGAIPIVTGLCLTTSLCDKPIYGFYVRKKPKDRGTNNLIEGNLKPNSNILVVEDVTTTGSSALKVVEITQSFGCSVVKVISIVDRQMGAKERFDSLGIEFESLLTRSDFRL